ncbi:hypothetical protein AB3S75_002874 [Citrus x aurantiifolia]
MVSFMSPVNTPLPPGRHKYVPYAGDSH